MEIAIAMLLTYLLCCRKSFRLDPEHLLIETDVLGFKRSKAIRKGSIQRLVQVEDGGERGDSFPSWGLKVEGDKNMTLIYRQPYEQSHWLGQILAKWAGVEFAEVPRK